MSIATFVDWRALQLPSAVRFDRSPHLQPQRLPKLEKWTLPALTRTESAYQCGWR